MTAAEALIEKLTANGYSPRPAGGAWSARCPAHEDRNPSLSVRQIEGMALVRCHAGCRNEDVVEALGLSMRDLFDEPTGARYTYTDPVGKPTRTVHRTPDKRFRQSGDTAAQPQLYRLHAIPDAVKNGRPIYLVEGEKDVHALESIGAVATTSPMGSSNFSKVDTAPLAGAHVVVVPDQDEAGERYLRDVLHALDGLAASVRVTKPKAGKDAADHVAAGYGLDDLELDATPKLNPDEPFKRAVSDEAFRLRVRDAATRMVRQERASALPAVPKLLSDFLAVADHPTRYRVDQLWPAGGRALLAAQFKAGKTTMVANLIRVLADGGNFLGRFGVTPPQGRVVLLDDELDENMLRRWLRDQQIQQQDRVAVCGLRGRVASLDLLDPEVRATWATRLRELDASVVVLDCLRPVLDALGLSEDKDVGRFLVAFDALLAEAGIGEAVVVHHMGHAGERSRGDSRLRDWPDAEWRLVREKDDGETAPDARRFFAAYGRDVDVPEGLLDYDPDSRRLTLAGGSRRETAGDHLVPNVLEYLKDHPAVSGRKIEEDLGKAGHRRAEIRAALKRGIEQRRITTTDGPKNATLHHLAAEEQEDPDQAEHASAPSAPEVRQRTSGQCDSAPIDGALTLTLEHSRLDGALNELQDATRRNSGESAPTAVTSLNGKSGTAAGAVGGVGAVGDPLPVTCSHCGEPLLLRRPGRDVCARCDLAGVA